MKTVAKIMLDVHDPANTVEVAAMVHLVDDHRRRSGGAALLDCIVDPAVPLLGLGARGVLGHEGIDPFVHDLEPGVRRGGAVGRAGVVSLHVALARFGQGDLRLGDLRADEAAEGDPRHSLSSGFQSPLGGSDQLLCLSAELIAPEAAGVHGLVGFMDLAITAGADMLLGLGAVRASQGHISIATLAILMMLGNEVFRPVRELGRLYHEQKRVRLFPEIWRQLCAAGIPFSWTIAGEGPEQPWLEQTLVSSNPAQKAVFR